MIADELKQATLAVREGNADVIESMPDHAMTTAQERLEAKHGTPRAFAQAVVNAIGEISWLEAHTAIARYKEKWDEAGRLNDQALAPVPATKDNE